MTKRETGTAVAVAAVVAALGAFATSCSSSTFAPAPIACASGQIAEFPPAANGAGPDLSCAGVGIQPKLTCNQITIAGSMVDVLTSVPVPNGTIEAFDMNERSIAKANAADDATYSISFATGPGGFRGRVVATAQDRWLHDGYYYSRPLVVGQADFNPGLATAADLVTLAALVMSKPIDPTKAILDPWAVDCAGNGIANATVDIDAPYDARFYAGSGLPDPSLKATTAAKPGALFVNVQPGPVMVTVRATNPDGSPGAVLGHGRGVARAGYWSAIFTSPE